MRLSILICTLPERAQAFKDLVVLLGVHTDVEILSDAAPRGTLSVGAKRQALLERAAGDYVVFIDDDDLVPPFYVPTILAALVTSPDCVGHYELVEGMAKVPQISIWTNAAPRWMEGVVARSHFRVDFVRTTFHKTPLKRSHALAVGFADMGFGEDHDFSKRLRLTGLCKREVFIPRVLYFYHYDPTPKAYQ